MEIIEHNCIHYLRKISQKDKTFKEVNREEERKYLNILGDFLVDYGILDRFLIEKVSEILSEREIQKAFIELLAEVNEDIKELFSFNDDS